MLAKNSTSFNSFKNEICYFGQQNRTSKIIILFNNSVFLITCFKHPSVLRCSPKQVLPAKTQNAISFGADEMTPFTLHTLLHNDRKSQLFLQWWTCKPGVVTKRENTNNTLTQIISPVFNLHFHPLEANTHIHTADVISLTRFHSPKYFFPLYSLVSHSLAPSFC